jgi:hypothetical protein
MNRTRRRMTGRDGTGWLVSARRLLKRGRAVLCGTAIGLAAAVLSWLGPAAHALDIEFSGRRYMTASMRSRRKRRASTCSLKCR